ncbi:Uncharacterized protein ABJ98_0231 [Pseudomonas syringae pv. aceris]|nr:Uncharacterized protein ABJ98_0231 [Pseudomonas syringae pv. aceris]
MLAQLVDIEAHAGRCHAIGHQLQTCFIAFQRLRQHHGVGHVVQGLQKLADLARFDPVAADFHLIVSTAQVFQHAVHPPRTVARPVQALTIGVRVRHKAFGGHCRTAQITLRQPAPAQIQFTGHPFGHRIEVSVQYPRLTVGQRLTDRHTAAGAERPGHFVGQDADRGFGRAVVVDDAAARFERTHLLDQRPGAGLSPQNQHLPWQHVRRVGGLQQALQMAGHDFQHVNLMLGHVTRKTVRVERLFVRQQVQRPAGRQRTEQQRVPQVGSDRRHHRHARPVVQCQAPKHALHIVGQRAVADHHALGLPSGAGGVDDVRRLPGQHPNVQRLAVDSGPQRSIERQHRAHAQPRGLVVIGRMHQQHRAAVTGQLLQALGRLRAVQWQVHRAQLQHRQQADHPFHRAVQAHCDGHARFDVLGVQVAGELVTTCLKLVKAQHLRAHTQRSLATPGTQALLPEAEEIGAGKVLGLLGDR